MKLLLLSLLLLSCGDETVPDAFAPLMPGRVDGEYVLDGAGHPLGLALVTRVFLPDGSSPIDDGPAYPVAFGYHGSGGLVREPDTPGDPCTSEIETKYQEMTDLLLAAGVAAVWIDSFTSRDERFCEDDNDDFRQFAPPVMDGALQQVVSRLYDSTSAEKAFCGLARFDCASMMRLGTSEGGTTALLPTHRYLEHAFEQLFDVSSSKNRLDELTQLAYAPLPRPRPEPKVVFAISPGCGFHSAVPLSTEGEVEDLFYPAEDVYLELGTTDTVPAECSTAIGAGRRQLQAEAVQALEGIAAADFRYKLTLHEGAGHPLWEERTELLSTKLGELVEQYLR